MSIEKYISPEMINAIKVIHSENPEIVFCGSLSMIIKGNLKRKVKDIDIITNENYYSKGGFFNELRVEGNSHSQEFMIDNVKVKCFKLQFMAGVMVDVLHTTEKIEYNPVSCFGITINIETIESAIKAKKDYITSNSNVFSVIKHLKDLIRLDIPKKELIDIINSSSVLVYQDKYHYENKDIENLILPGDDNFTEDDLPF